MQQPLCYVIATHTSKVINDCTTSLDQYSWKFKVFPAVNGQMVTQEDWEKIGIAMSTSGKMRSRPGAQGCWLSHYALWKKCIISNEPIVILEHDAVINGPWPDKLDISTQLVKLYSSAECKVNPAYGRWSKGAHAYTVTPDQAKRLIEYAQDHGAQAVDKHLGDLVLPWTFLDYDLVKLNPRRGPSSTSPLKKN
jgi:GR25 family glycosyltransferase involved in LPS biosynthesis